MVVLNLYFSTGIDSVAQGTLDSMRDIFDWELRWDGGTKRLVGGRTASSPLAILLGSSLVVVSR